MPIPLLVMDFTERSRRTGGFSERRRDRRVNLTSRLGGCLMELDEPVSVTQVGEGGMTLVTRSPLSPRTTHEFQVVVGQTPLLVTGIVRHTRVIVRNDDVSYQTGIEFVNPPAELTAHIEDLLTPIELDRSA